MNNKFASIYISATVLSGIISVPTTSTVVKRYPRLDIDDIIYNMGELRFSNEQSYSIKKTDMDNEEESSSLNNNSKKNQDESLKQDDSIKEENDSKQEDTSNNNQEDSSQDKKDAGVIEETTQNVTNNDSYKKEDAKIVKSETGEEPSQEETVPTISDEEVEKANEQKEKAKEDYKDLERFDQDDKEITIPRVNGDVNTNEIVDVPQGIAMDDEYVYISSYDGIKGYLSDLGKSSEQVNVHNSVIYVLRLNDKKKYKVIVLPEVNHVGGLTCLNGQLWITLSTGNDAGQKLVYLNTKPILDQLDWSNDDEYIVDHYDGENKINGVKSASFVTSYNNDLYVGTFDETSNSIIKGYHPGSEDAFVSYSVIQKAQGAAFMTVDDITYLMVSSSYGRKNSSGLYAYVVNNVGQSNSTIDGYSAIVLPGMAEGIVEKDGTFYMLTESASPRYNANPSNSATSPIGKILAGTSSNMIGGQRQLSDKEVTVSINKTSFAYNNTIQYPTVTTVKYKNMYLPYSVKYTASKTPGVYVMSININTPTYSYTKNINYTINKANANSVANVSLSKTSYTYNGKIHKPVVKSVTLYGHTIKVKSINYVSPNSKSVGIYTIEIILEDNPYASTVIHRTYEIKPKTTKIKSHKSKKGAITLKWKKQKGTRYQIQYSTYKSMKHAKSKKFKSATSTTLKHLARKKYYYIRIRTYKIVKGKYIYSSYSSIKRMRTK